MKNILLIFPILSINSYEYDQQEQQSRLRHIFMRAMNIALYQSKDLKKKANYSRPTFLTKLIVYILRQQFSLFDYFNTIIIMSGIKSQTIINRNFINPQVSTILSIQCGVQGLTLPYKLRQKRIDPKKRFPQELNEHINSNYRCSPLDLDCLIQANMTFSLNGKLISKQFKSDMVKISPQILELKTFVNNPFRCLISFTNKSIEVEMRMDEQRNLRISRLDKKISISVSANRIIVQTIPISHNCLKVYFKSKVEDFQNFYFLIQERKPQTKQQLPFLFVYKTERQRNIMLLGIIEASRQMGQNNAKMPWKPTNHTRKESYQSLQNKGRMFISNNDKKLFYDNRQENMQHIKINKGLQILKQSVLQKKQDQPTYPDKQPMRQHISSLNEDPHLAAKPQSQQCLNRKLSFFKTQNMFREGKRQRQSNIFKNNSQISNKWHREMQELKRQNEILIYQLQTQKMHRLSRQNEILEEVRILSRQINNFRQQIKQMNITILNEAQEREQMKRELQHFKQLLSINSKIQ